MSNNAGPSASALQEMHLKIKTLQPATYEVTVDVQVVHQTSNGSRNISQVIQGHQYNFLLQMPFTHDYKKSIQDSSQCKTQQMDVKEERQMIKITKYLRITQRYVQLTGLLYFADNCVSA